MSARVWYYKTGLLSSGPYNDMMHAFCAGYMKSFETGTPSFTIGYIKCECNENEFAQKDILTITREDD